MTRPRRTRVDAGRGLSTPIDVAVALLLVGGAVSVVAGIHPDVLDTPDHRGSVFLGATMEVTYDTPSGPAQVSGTMGGLLGDAVRAGVGTPDARERVFRAAVRESVARRVSAWALPIQVVGFCREPGVEDTAIVVGQTVPPDQPIQATVYPLPRSRGNASADRCRPAIVVRRWST